MIVNFFLIAAGLVLLVVGGEFIVRGAVALATRLNLSKALIGTVLVGFGTSLPEFFATFGAAAQGQPDIAFGNVIGSNTANILMILGLSALICPIAIAQKGLVRDGVFVSLASLGALMWIWLGGIPLWGASFLIVLFVFYMFLSVRADRLAAADTSNIEIPPAVQSVPLALFLALAGTAALVFGADFLITGASAIASAYGVPTAIIGITIVGVGTSLPEASASVIASFKKENELAFGNIVGSNVFNGLAILGITGAVFPLRFGAGFSLADGIILCAATAAMFIFAMTRKKVERWEGAAFFIAYLVYLIWLVMRAMA